MCITAGTLGALGTGASALGQVAGGLGTKRAAGAAASAEELQAEEALVASKEEAKRIRKAGARAQGDARAQYGASGVDVNSGSAVTVEREIGTLAEQDAMNALLTGQRQYRAGMTSAAQTRYAGDMAMGGSLLSAAGNVGLRGWKGVNTPSNAHLDGITASRMY